MAFYTTFFVYSRPFPPSNPSTRAPRAHEIDAIAQNYNIRGMQTEQRLSEAERMFRAVYCQLFFAAMNGVPYLHGIKKRRERKEIFFVN